MGTWRRQGKSYTSPAPPHPLHPHHSPILFFKPISQRTFFKHTIALEKGGAYIRCCHLVQNSQTKPKIGLVIIYFSVQLSCKERIDVKLTQNFFYQHSILYDAIFVKIASVIHMWLPYKLPSFLHIHKHTLSFIGSKPSNIKNKCWYQLNFRNLLIHIEFFNKFLQCSNQT